MTIPARVVCFYFVATHLGGAERSVLELLRGMMANPDCGYRPLALVPKFDGALLEELKKLGIPIEIIPMPKRFLSITRRKPLLSLLQGWYSLPVVPPYIYKVQAYFRREKPDLIYSVGIKCHLFAGIISPLTSTPVLWHLRDLLPPGPTLSTLRTVGRLPMVHFAANSQSTADSFRGTTKGQDARIPVVHNGLSPNDYAPLPNRNYNRAFGVNVVIGSEIYDTLGERGVLKTLEAEVERLGLANTVHFAGYVKNPAEAINGLDVLVHASIEPEPFGRVVAEAMACGVAVAAAGAGGILELVDNGKTGLLFQPGNVAEMTHAVLCLLDDSQLRQRLAAAGRARFLSRFTNETYFSGMMRVFDQIVFPPAAPMR
ncbi:MAG: glycosyltransferase family 4 protein [Deltaproteobacteria bacterium]|nr:glycosyltransferase family 4 protein [Deltaproteobacteria bacterium]